MATTKTTDATPETTDVQAPAAVKAATATAKQTAAVTHAVTHAVTSRPLVETAAPSKGEPIEGALADRRIPVSRPLS